MYGLTARLGEHDGQLCIVLVTHDYDKPRKIHNFYATTHRVAHVKDALGELSDCSVSNSYGSEYKISTKNGATFHVCVDGGAKPVHQEFSDLPAPKRCQKSEYREGAWHYLNKSGWRRL